MTCSDFRKQARENLKGKWGKAALITLLYFLIIFLYSFLTICFKKSTLLVSCFDFAYIVLAIPLSYSFFVNFMKIKRNEDVKPFDFIKNIFTYFGKAWSLIFRIFLKLWLPIVLYLVTLLLLVVTRIELQLNPTVAISTFYIIFSIVILAIYIWLITKSFFYVLSIPLSFDHPDLNAKEIVNESEKLMTKNRFKYFLLSLSFIGWVLLGILSIYIGFLWIIPYLFVANVCFYEHLVEQSNNK